MTAISGALNKTGYNVSGLSRQSPDNSAKPEAAAANAASAALTSTSSSRKSFTDVAQDARAALNARYEDLGVSSDNYRHRTGTFRRDMFDAMDFDRRTLYAVASNEGGQFSEEETKAARSAMRDQLSDAMKAAGGLSGSNHAAGHKAAISFLDSAASAEEKASFEWAKERTAAQVSYQMETRGRGENVDSDNPVVNLLLEAYQELFAAYDKDMNERLENMPSYERALKEWAKINNTDHTYSVKV